MKVDSVISELLGTLAVAVERDLVVDSAAVLREAAQLVRKGSLNGTNEELFAAVRKVTKAVAEAEPVKAADLELDVVPEDDVEADDPDDLPELTEEELDDLVGE